MKAKEQLTDLSSIFAHLSRTTSGILSAGTLNSSNSLRNISFSDFVSVLNCDNSLSAAY